MFREIREIRREERITDRDRKIKQELRYWQEILFDTRIGTPESDEALRKVRELEALLEK